MLAKRVFQWVLALVESAVSAGIALYTTLAIGYLYQHFIYQIDVYLQPIDEWPGFFEEVVDLSLLMSLAVVLVAHAFRLIVHEKF